MMSKPQDDLQGKQAKTATRGNGESGVQLQASAAREPEVIARIEEAATKKAVQLVAASFVGPLPPPDIFRAYGEIVPDAPERILRVFESEVEHRHDLERISLNANIAGARRGQWFALIVTVFALACGLVAILSGYGAAGIATILTSLGGLVGALVWSEIRKSGKARGPAGTQQSASQNKNKRN
jgi:uncharacterized membrane protein